MSKHRKFVLMMLLVLLAGMLPVATITAQDGMSYNEAPELAEMVEAGELPPVAERLPENPLVVEPIESIGQYGGAWRMGMSGGMDHVLLLRTIAYEGLIRWAPDWSGLEPNIAESWGVNDEGTVFTFNLRQGVKWSDGVEFTSADIMFWYEDMILNTDLYPAPPSWLMSGGEVVTVTAPDEYTVVFTFAEPNGLFLQRLATPEGMTPTLFARHYLEQFHIDYNPDGIDALMEEAGVDTWTDLFRRRGGWWSGSEGAGVYRNPGLPTLNAWMVEEPIGPETTQALLVRNPYYFKVDPEGNQLPYLDAVSLRVFDNVETMVLATLNGEINMQDRHIATLDNKALFFDSMEEGDFRFYDLVPSSMNTAILALNLTHPDPVKREIYGNKDFRIGLSHAINREEIINIVYLGQGTPYQAAPRPTSPFYHEQLATQYTEYDVDLANQYLDQAGFSERDGEGYRLGPDGDRIIIPVEIRNTETDVIATFELIQGYMEAVGIDLRLEVEDRSLLYERKEANEHDAVVWAGDGGLDVVLEPRWYFPYSHESNFAIAWHYFYNDPENALAEEPSPAALQQQQLYDELKATADADRQAELMNQILDIAAEEFYVIGLVLPAANYGIVSNDFRNVPASMPQAWLYPNPGPTNTFQYYIEQ